MKIVALPGLNLCRCGQGVAQIPAAGTVLCPACFEAQRPGDRVVMVALPKLQPSPSLNTVLARLAGKS